MIAQVHAQDSSRARPRSRARVLVVEEGWATTLPVVRAIRRAGHEVTVLTANGAAKPTRHKRVDWHSAPALDAASFVQYVDTFVARGGFDLILPLTEAVMERMWETTCSWVTKIFPQVEAWQRRLVFDKHLLIEHLADRSIPIPKHRRVVSGLDVMATVREFGLPLVVKGDSGSDGSRVRIVETIGELADALAEATVLGGEWIAQEYVASPTFLVGGVFHAGEPLCLYAAEKLAQHPPRVGGATRVRSLSDPALVELGTRIVRELRWTGFASVDLVRRADGQYLLLEVNPRPWRSLAGAAAAAVDLFTPFTALLSGTAPIAKLDFVPGVDTWIFPKYLESAEPRGVLAWWRGVRDLFGEQGRDWRDLRFAPHLIRRIQRTRSLARIHALRRETMR